MKTTSTRTNFCLALGLAVFSRLGNAFFGAVYTRALKGVGIFMLLFLSACQHLQFENPEEKLEALKRSVVTHYADVAHAVYEDSYHTAEKLRHAVTMLVLSPSQSNLEYAREAWRNARVPYQQSEVFRFGHSVVDEWEGQLNAWPLDEGLIDYVDSNYYEAALGNAGAKANIVANKILRVGTKAINASTITPELIKSVNEIGGSEANVASGYHAIEFLLWGQDLNGTSVGAGERPYTDYGKGKACTNKHCDRRGAYLIAAAQLLVDDLSYMVQQWSVDGEYRKVFLSLPSNKALDKMIFSMGALSFGELAGERMKVALEANSVEDEHDCFSDNTHYSHFYNALGIQNIFLGQYKTFDGPQLSGPSLSLLLQRTNSSLEQDIRLSINDSVDAVQQIVSRAEDPISPMPFDVMIAEGNREGETLIRNAISKLRVQTELLDTFRGSINTLALPVK